MVAGSPVTLEVPVELVEPMGSDTLVWAQLGNKPFRVRMDGMARVSSGTG
jgi:multiple sugar transport system ATP-binding protein